MENSKIKKELASHHKKTALEPKITDGMSFEQEMREELKCVLIRLAYAEAEIEELKAKIK